MVRRTSNPGFDRAEPRSVDGQSDPCRLAAGKRLTRFEMGPSAPQASPRRDGHGYSFSHVNHSKQVIELGPPVRRGWPHGYLADVPAMRAAFFVAGPGIPAGRSLGEIDMRDVAPTLAGVLGVRLPAAEGRDLIRLRRPD